MPRNDIPDSGATPGPEGSSPLGKKLVSWKEISAHLGREVRTVQRWERTEGLPVHRHEHLKKSTVYAYAGELDAWFKKRQPKDDPEADAAFAREIALSGTDSPIESDDVPVVPPSPEPSPVPDKPGPPSPAKRVAVAVAAVAILSLVSYGVYRLYNTHPPTQEKIRLVVLPFANLSGDSKQDYLSVGLTDVITTQLGRLDPEHLGVIAPTSAKVMSGKPISEIRQKLDVQYVLDGSVQPRGNQIRIDIRLIKTSDEAQAGSDTYTKELSDFLRVESDVAEGVARMLSSTLPVGSQFVASEAVTPHGVVTAEAASKSSEAFLKGEILWNSRGDFSKSTALFETAIQEDPYNAQAYAGLAKATALNGQVPNDGMLPQEAKPKAREAALHALKLDPRLAEAYSVLGNVAMSYDWDFPEAERQFKTALKLNPNYPFAHEWYAHLLMVEGRFDEALAESRHVLELDPATALFHVIKAEMLYHSRRYDEAIEEASSVVKAHPEVVLAYYWLGCAYREKKMYPEAIATFERVRKMAPDLPFMVMAVGHAQAVAGNTVEARKALNTLAQMKRTRIVPDLYPAAIHVGLGEKDQAFQLLDSALKARVDRLVYLNVEPMADPLRSDPRFAQLLARIGFH
jgi:TolB-like protein/tetratricopeptide (TPR) repeat protein